MGTASFRILCFEVKSAYQKSSWFKSLFHETNFGCGAFQGHATLENFENGALRLGKNAFTANSYCHEVS